MTDLIKSQLTIMATMFCCGLCGGLIYFVFKEFIRIRKIKGIVKHALELLYFIFLGVLISEFTYFCDRGKITLLSAIFFILGLLLWNKLFYDILYLGDSNEEKEKQPPGI